jgi:hypothetical protein
MSKKAEEDPVIEIEDDDEEMEDEEMFNPLEDLLVTDDGENIANAIKGALDRIGKHLENQNKILIKIYSSLKPGSAA